MNNTTLQEDFELLRNHCIDIRCKYNTYTNLYRDENRSLLSKAAAVFFTDLAEILHRDWILQVCKLMDPAETERKGEIFRNVTIQLIDMQLDKQGLMSSEISSVSTRISSYGDKIIPARNKRIAHYDREHQINNVVLGETSEEDLDQFLDNIQQYCDLVGLAIGVGPLDFSASGCAGDVIDLLKVLKRGVGA